MFFKRKSAELPTAETALPGRDTPIPTATRHYTNHAQLQGPYPAGYETIYFGLGCFWGAERRFWSIEGVHVTAVGYQSGLTPNPTYQEVCSGQTGHNEVVMVVYDPNTVALETLLKVFWESHDPTQHMRQGNDVGTQYRSGIYTTTSSQHATVLESKRAYEMALGAKGFGPVMTEVLDAPTFYFAEEYHQQYLAKNPAGYCGLRGTGVSCPVPAPAASAMEAAE